MFKNYLKVAWRNITRHKGYAFVNIAGLAIGMACCILISFYVLDELSYDRYHPGADRTYRVIWEEKTQDATAYFEVLSGSLAPVIIENFPQIESAVRLLAQPGKLVESDAKRRFYETNFYYADPQVFDIFDVTFVHGDLETALKRPHTLVISVSISKKYFGDLNPIGKALFVKNREYEVTGVIKDCPHNTHLRFDLLTSIESIADIEFLTSWHLTSCLTYIKVKEGVDVEEFGAQIRNIADLYVGEELTLHGITYNYLLEPITDIHLYSGARFGIGNAGGISRVFIFSALAILILIIACLNFINLSTARQSRRAKEIGVRKIVGAQKTQLIMQFLNETLIFSVIALFISVVLVEISLPFFNELLDIRMNDHFSISFSSILICIIATLVTGVIAGSYPAFFLSSIRPGKIISGKLQQGVRNSSLRRALIVGQFIISTILIIGSITAYRQLDFMRNMDLGFEKDQIMVIPVRGISMVENYETLKSEFCRHNSVLSATVSSTVPGEETLVLDIGLVGEPQTKIQPMSVLSADCDFIGMYKVELADGEAYHQDRLSAIRNPIVINMSAVRALGLASSAEAIGKKLGGFDPPGVGNIVGVIKDVHFKSLRTQIDPMAIFMIPDYFRRISLQINTTNLPQAIAAVKGTWDQLFPQTPFQYYFLDTNFELQCASDARTGDMAGIFTLLAIFISCLGLSGLIAFSSEQRTKEIGVRKVHGASTIKIIRLMTIEFIWMTLLAAAIASPLAYIVVNQWLQEFAYRIQINLTTFLVAVFGILVITILSVSLQARKAALANPVESLRHE
jgi:putative ABC transport system permease protein